VSGSGVWSGNRVVEGSGVETKTWEQNPRKDKTMRNLIEKLMKDESGQDMAEYAIALAVVGVAVAAAFTTLSGNISTALGKANGILNP
jgi:pilus assembly protein Flp/PilA